MAATTQLHGSQRFKSYNLLCLQAGQEIVLLRARQPAAASLCTARLWLLTLPATDAAADASGIASTRLRMPLLCARACSSDTYITQQHMHVHTSIFNT